MMPMGRRLCVATAFLIAGVVGPKPAEAEPTLVEIETGSLRGVEVGDVISFKGIPYAAPPVGDLRWRVPQPAKAWQGVLSADKFGPECMQPDDVPK